LLTTHLFGLIELKLLDHERTLTAAAPNSTWVC
jgi:hypothetical protein